MLGLGIDIGTTTICAVIVDSANGQMMYKKTVANTGFINAKRSFERIQDATKILNIVDKLVAEAKRKFKIASIGITGQMHGIVYVDENMQPLSHLYTWQDKRANEIYKDGKSYIEHIHKLTGKNVPTGYGVATHFYNSKNELIPPKTKGVITIQGLAALRLCGLSEVVSHSSDCASLGLYDINNHCFYEELFDKLGLSVSIFPRSVKDFEAIGYHDNIPVCAAIGDNQASYLGSVSDFEHDVLVNAGTGSQISIYSEKIVTSKNIECRPLYDKKYILVGSSLSGGRAYAMLDIFFKQVLNMAGYEVDTVLPFMDKALEKHLLKTSLKVETTLAGTRSNPNKSGSIMNLCDDNFTPEDFMIGFMNGMAHELYQYYVETGSKCSGKIIGSGNTIRKNAAFAKILSGKFEMPLHVPVSTEEASFGAALTGFVAANIFKSIKETRHLVTYKELLFMKVS